MSPWAHLRTSVVIDIAALKHNLSRIRLFAPTSNVMAVIKANAYGHGAVCVSNALDDLVDGFGVASVDEGVTLRRAGVKSPITILSAFYLRDEVEALSKFNLTPVIHSVEQEQLLLDYLDNTLDVWLKLDSGMHRMGLTSKELHDSTKKLSRCQFIRDIRIMSHLANADDLTNEYTNVQLRYFLQNTNNTYQRSLANSAGVVGWPETHFEWVRSGLMLYGASPIVGKSAKEFDLHPVMTFKAKLIAIKHLNEGNAVGYGGDWTCPQAMRIGVVSCGYGDGYPRQIDDKAFVLLNGKSVPIIGRVSMDVMSIDLRGHDEARVNDDVTLWGQGLPVDDIAAHADTIPYTLLSLVTSRVPRMEINSG